MPELTVRIGERDFTVACQDGEEAFLQSAAKMLDTEATTIIAQVGRMPTERMLLMAALMLADKTASLEEDLAARTDAIVHMEGQLVELKASKGPEAVAVIPTEIEDHLAELAARAEALADELEADPG